jgi:hypothetical protein
MIGEVVVEGVEVEVCEVLYCPICGRQYKRGDADG